MPLEGIGVSPHIVAYVKFLLDSVIHPPMRPTHEPLLEKERKMQYECNNEHHGQMNVCRKEGHFCINIKLAVL